MTYVCSLSSNLRNSGGKRNCYILSRAAAAGGAALVAASVGVAVIEGGLLAVRLGVATIVQSTLAFPPPMN